MGSAEQVVRRDGIFIKKGIMCIAMFDIAHTVLEPRVGAPMMRSV